MYISSGVISFIRNFFFIFRFDEQRLPQSQWAKKIMTSLPRPVVMKHNHREMNVAKRRLLSHQEDSFADLPCQQAEVSICTQKTAFKPN